MCYEPCIAVRRQPMVKSERSAKRSRHGCLYRTHCRDSLERDCSGRRIACAAINNTKPMAKIPLMDYVGNPLLICLFVALLWLQWRFPLRRQHFKMLHRLVVGILSIDFRFAIVRVAMLPIPIAIAMWARHQRVGLLNRSVFRRGQP